MKILKGFLILIVLFSVFSACGPYNRTYNEPSQVLEEDALVVDLAYTPSRHGDGSGVGITTSGDVAIVSTSVDIPEKYAIVFKCQHGKFIIECNTPERKKLWMDLDEGQKVKVLYKEMWKATYRIYKSEKTLLARRLKDYWFLNAVPIKE